MSYLLPDEWYYESMENFQCPYDHECTDCEYDCGDDL